MDCEKCGSTDGDLMDISELPIVLCNACGRQFQLDQQNNFEDYRLMGQLYAQLRGLEALLKGGVDCLDDYVKVSTQHSNICKKQCIFVHRWLIG